MVARQAVSFVDSPVAIASIIAQARENKCISDLTLTNILESFSRTLVWIKILLVVTKIGIVLNVKIHLCCYNIVILKCYKEAFKILYISKEQHLIDLSFVQQALCMKLTGF